MVTMIGATMLDWDTFIKLCYDNLEYSPTKRLDEARQSLDQTTSFLAALAYLEGETASPEQAILKSEKLLDYLSYVVVVTEYCSEALTELRHKTDLNVTFPGEQSFAVCSGTLRDWFNMTLICCNKTARPELQEIGTQIVHMFERAGFAIVWRNTRRKESKNTIFLERT